MTQNTNWVQTGGGGGGSLGHFRQQRLTKMFMHRISVWVISGERGIWTDRGTTTTFDSYLTKLPLGVCSATSKAGIKIHIPVVRCFIISLQKSMSEIKEGQNEWESYTWNLFYHLFTPISRMPFFGVNIIIAMKDWWKAVAFIIGENNKLSWRHWLFSNCRSL